MSMKQCGKLTEKGADRRRLLLENYYYTSSCFLESAVQERNVVVTRMCTYANGNLRLENGWSVQ